MTERTERDERISFDEFYSGLVNGDGLLRSFLQGDQADAERFRTNIRIIYDYFQTEVVELSPSLIEAVGFTWLMGYRDGYANGFTSEKMHRRQVKNVGR